MSDGLWVWILILISAIGATCFYAGWKASSAYLTAALSVSDLTNAVARDSNSTTSALDRFEASVASLRESVNAHQGAITERQKAVEEVLEILFRGFERAGYVGRSNREAPGRQVGEAPSESS